MGIEYRHFIVVNESAWRPESDTAARVEAVFRQWSLVEQLKKVVDLSLGSNNKLLEALPATLPGPGLAFVYAGIEGEPVQRIAGPSAYEDVNASDRYTMETTLVIGDDYRVQWSSESISFELVSPPIADGQPVIGLDDEEPFNTLFEQSLPSEGITTLPVVVANVAEHARHNVAWQNCLGYWRAAVVIDFGKDLPSFTEDVHMLPAREFVADVAAAFRASVIEIGEFY
jgi:hypothetical protein